MRKVCADAFAALAFAATTLAPVLAEAAGGGGEEGPPAVQIGKEKLFPVNVTWIAQSVDGKQPWSSPADRPTIFLDKQLRAKGFDGCNTFSVTAYPLKGQKLAVGPLAVTRKACDPQIVSSERLFLNAVRGAREWDMQGANVLILKGLGGTLQFERGL